MCQEYSSIYKYAVIVNAAFLNNFDTDGTPYYMCMELHCDKTSFTNCKYSVCTYTYLLENLPKVPYSPKFLRY